jgi:hypothetical protein
LGFFFLDAVLLHEHFLKGPVVEATDAS